MRKILLIIVIILALGLAIKLAFKPKSANGPQPSPDQTSTGADTLDSQVNTTENYAAELVYFDLADMEKGESRTLNVEGEDCQSGCSIFTDYFFVIDNSKFKIEVESWTSGGTAGGGIYYQISVLDERNEGYENLGRIASDEQVKIIRYKDNIILVGTFNNEEGQVSERIFVYNFVEGKKLQFNTLSEALNTL
jgi:uncharacterized protein YpmB